LDASNDLAAFLANILDNMEQSISKSGSGSGQGFQLPDIIQGQGEVKNKLEGMGKSGVGKKGEEGASGKDGDKPGKGENGKEGNGGGKNGNSNGDGDSEQQLEELYDIYKEQDRLRQELENQLKNMVNGEEKQLGGKLTKLMQDFQDDLLENGITPRTMERMNNIEYQLLKLQGAALKQGQKSERESRTNRDDFRNPIITKPSLLENYHNDLEILDRDALPLRQNYQNRVKYYFKEND